MPDLTETERGQLLGFLKVALQKRAYTRRLVFLGTTVIRTIRKKSQPRNGRPNLLNFEHKQMLLSESAERPKNCLMKEPDLMFLLKLLGNFFLAFRHYLLIGK